MLCFLIDYNQAAPRVYYQFNIEEIPKIRNETSKHCNDTNSETKEIITGWRESIFQDPNNATNSTEEIYYLEKVDFNHDENGYHVNYNVSELEMIPNMETEEVITLSPQHSN